ncbi:hypothetical protein [Agilicoccus flavus]|uniref:hypothetical protein n=1 Tax=Agilicoccus flavus TaxID=2775968 RepID=UPI001CF627C5|nr:hypothetical protein [Agilicoccus flavus]
MHLQDRRGVDPIGQRDRGAHCGRVPHDHRRVPSPRDDLGFRNGARGCAEVLDLRRRRGLTAQQHGRERCELATHPGIETREGDGRLVRIRGQTRAEVDGDACDPRGDGRSAGAAEEAPLRARHPGDGILVPVPVLVRDRERARK